MVEWSITTGELALNERPLWLDKKEGKARSSAEVWDQARNHLEWELNEGTLVPGDMVFLMIDGRNEYLGTIEGFMGKTALRRMGLD